MSNGKVMKIHLIVGLMKKILLYTEPSIFENHMTIRKRHKVWFKFA